MLSKTSIAALSLLASVRAQQVGTYTAEVHPPLSYSTCTGSGCTSQAGKVVIDANWRWLHSTTSATNCYTGNTWNTQLCPAGDSATCTSNCALDGAAYQSTYGITTSADSLRLAFITGSNGGSRSYLMDTDSTYKVFKLKGMEFTFDVDVSNLHCGLNGALYFVTMDADGGMSKYPTNKAGAKYGTGYCDAQCPRDLKFISGVANNVGWGGSSANSGKGDFGSCCAEMDIWEANKMSSAYTPHNCDTTGQTKCTAGADCTRNTGLCDGDGCDFNSYRQNNKTFYGEGKTVDTTKKITVVTQFITNDGTPTGTLTEIKRFYVQNGVVIPNSQSNVLNNPGNSITDSFCAAQKSVFGDVNYQGQKGGLTAFSKQLDLGMVLVLSIWDDYDVSMHWLDSTFPPGKDVNLPGVARGSCNLLDGVPATVEAAHPGDSVTFSAIKFGPIGSTFAGAPVVLPPNPPSSTIIAPTSTLRTSTTSRATTTTTTSRAATTTVVVPVPSPTGAVVAKWGQCGGLNYAGPTQCVAGTVCTKSNDWFYQCV